MRHSNDDRYPSSEVEESEMWAAIIAKRRRRMQPTEAKMELNRRNLSFRSSTMQGAIQLLQGAMSWLAFIH